MVLYFGYIVLYIYWFIEKKFFKCDFLLDKFLVSFKSIKLMINYVS